MEISFDDKDLEELIFTGKNRKYKKLSKDKVFMKALVDVYNYTEYENGIRITIIELNETHYGRKK